MLLAFSKYHGAGNDFIIVDNRDGVFPKETGIIKNLCDRHFGIGADGLMLLEKSSDADFYMRYFNSDGNESTMCGNGGRCITVFAKQLGIIETTAHFIGIDGEHSANIEDSKLVNLKMQDVNGLEIGDGYYFLNTGSPHYVCFIENIKEVDVNNYGSRIRHSFNLQNGGTNVNFIEIKDEQINIRTFERGVESETLACGTGSVASAIVYSYQYNKVSSEFVLNTQGGQLLVKFTKSGDQQYSNIWLKGPVEHVFDGKIEI